VARRCKKAFDRSNFDENDPELKARYDRREAELEQPDHTELIARLRDSALFCELDLSD
jgi:hypothetical protein